jgi:predicted alpha/beta-fold hydrolase
MRNCGGSDQLTPTLYHSGLSGDVGAVLAHMQQKFGLERIVLGGYSMGGNLVLKLAGELGSAAPAALRGVIAVSPAVDLAPSADALHEPANRVYEWHFLRGLRRRFLRKAALFPARYSPAALARVRSLRDFDEYVMAPCSGFAGADDYYYRAASARVVDRIAVPTLLLHALDDPFIRLEEETRRRLRSNPAITLLETPRGGHCAFLAAEPGEDSRWAEKTLLGFALGAG